MIFPCALENVVNFGLNSCTCGSVVRTLPDHMGGGVSFALAFRVVAYITGYDSCSVKAITSPHRSCDEAFEDVKTMVIFKPAVVVEILSSGVVINNASGSAVRPTRGEAPYAAAKAGLVALTSSIAQEYGPRIRANCVSPGVIRTPMSETLFSVPELLEPFLDANPADRAGTVADVASLFVFLASDESGYLNGQNLVLDGGGGLAQPGIDDVLRFAVPPLEPRKKD